MTINHSKLAKKFSELWWIVRNSPMLAIRYKYIGAERTIYAKNEQFNITGSFKDRMALYILQNETVNNAVGVTTFSDSIKKYLRLI
jgi:cysteine synthase A